MAVKKASAKKATGTKAAAQTPSRKTAAKTPAKKSAGEKYSPEASATVARELHEMHEGKLTIGKSDKKVTNPKQAIAIGLAEARRAGKKVPPNPHQAGKG